MMRKEGSTTPSVASSAPPKAAHAEADEGGRVDGDRAGRRFGDGHDFENVVVGHPSRFR